MIVINTGATANNGLGDKLRDAFIIVNENFASIDTLLSGNNALTISQITGLQTALNNIQTQLDYIPDLQGDINSINNTIFTINLTLNSQNISIADLYSEITNLQTQIFTKVEEAPIDGESYVRKDADWVLAPTQSQAGATQSNITKTSDLVNDGEDGTSPFVTADQLPSNLNLFATDTLSDIATYFKLVTSISDPDFDVTPVDIPTGAITTTGQFIAALATSVNVLVGNPGIINLLTIGNVRRTTGTGTAEFYYEVYHRDSVGTETLISTSSKTPPVSAAVYTEFLASALLNNGVFLATDRIVVKYYADRIAGGSNPEYDFQFGGTSPVRTNFPVPATNIPLDATPTSGSTNGVQSGGVFDALDLKSNTTVATTGVDIFFVTPQIYNTASSAATANITNDLTGANLGVIQKIYHNHSVAPTVPGGWVLIGGEYTISELNIIYAEWCGSSRVEYWITQEV